jgi:hypothetical protein
MRIVQSPYQARIVPLSPGAPNLWRCVIEQEDSREVVVLHETARKEDARCMPCWNWRGWNRRARPHDGRRETSERLPKQLTEA